MEVIKLKKIKRLIKKSYHDVMNRDVTVLYIGGKFYEDVTYAVCLKQYINENNNENMQNRELSIET